MADCVSPSPDMNSAGMFAVPATEPLFMAAAAWEDLAAELGTSASSFEAVISLALGSGSWSDPESTSISTALRAAAESCLDLLKLAASQALPSAQDARLTASVFEATQTGALLPAAMAANRQMLASLVETNFFGQNAAAISCIEGVYAEMWARDLQMRSNDSSNQSTTSKLKPARALAADSDSPPRVDPLGRRDEF
ncbi:hypothetical protein NJB14197_27080 [Mycobacterium montefiorense]|uniref:PPE domain-containing protein n=2 Tax=Mycobacterium montefiorense TaxID=154654 RepID=A0AA37PNC1_9MYCO|nr:hypothetical protein MmonteBS_22490 [Mycobacterium montefiorense]GKU35015.1 hypothetical protein NJB14191_23610 [Mycobacterium montefiorense]GKU41026.1 hypothetical protein NJB14192_30120 [Mycobacterium montefiorense]GKU47137.1 hypothetical protein NJB14194_37550 [Mycobacterium montefiorense]GKU49257.1 hypothetical protein NJB14195_05040 [Mycobacterium montefiorense]